LSLHEVAIELLQSGFDPRENKLLQEKILYIMKGIIKTSVEKYRIPLPESAMSFIVPGHFDPYSFNFEVDNEF